MTLNFTVYEDVIDASVMKKILALARKCEIGEDFDTKCDLIYTWQDGKKIVACIAFKKTKFADDRIVPRVEHIIFHPEFDSKKKARSSFLFLLKAFNDVKERGYQQVWAFIKPSKEYMKKLAVKFGFVKYQEDTDGEYFVLQLTGGK